MNKKRICVTIPYELYHKYRDNISFSGILTELLENMIMIDNLKPDSEIMYHIIVNNATSKPYSISINDVRNYISYIKEMNIK